MDHKSSFNLVQRYQYVGLWVLVDFVIIALAYTIVLISRTVNLSNFDIMVGFPMVIVTAIVIVATMYIAGVYQRIWSRTSGHGVAVIVLGVGSGALICGTLDLLQTPRPLPISVYIVGSVVALAGLVAVRYRSRLVSGCPGVGKPSGCGSSPQWAPVP